MGGRRRKSRKQKGGMGYGFTGTIGTAGAEYGSSWGGEVTKSGQPVFDTAQRGSSRRKSRKTRGGRKRGRKTRKQRGGMTVAHSSAGFAGEGIRGMAHYQDVGGSTKFANDVVPLSG